MRVGSECPGELGGESRLSDAALSGKHENLVGDGADALLDEGECGIGCVWGVGSADLLVWTACAGVYFSSEMRVCALLDGERVRGGGGRRCTGQCSGALSGMSSMMKR